MSGCRLSVHLTAAGNPSISLARNEEQINYSQQSPKICKMDSKDFIHALFFYRSFSQVFSLGAQHVIVGTAICKCITRVYAPFVISRLRTKAPDIKTTTVVDRLFPFRDQEVLSVHCAHCAQTY